jgi:hypothetical protein
MQTKKIPLLALVFVLLTVFSACKKDKKETPKSKTDLLTTGQWKMTAFTVSPPMDLDGDGIVDSDVYATMGACEKDDYYIFKKDGTLEQNEGASKCDPLDPQTETVDWSFVNDEKEIIFIGTRATILELTATRFRMSFQKGFSTVNIRMEK